MQTDGFLNSCLTRMYSSKMRTGRSLPYGGGGYRLLFTVGGVSVWGVSVWGVSVRETSSPRGQTDACENITFPQTSFVGGQYSLCSCYRMTTVKFNLFLSLILLLINLRFQIKYHIVILIKCVFWIKERIAFTILLSIYLK